MTTAEKNTPFFSITWSGHAGETIRLALCGHLSFQNLPAIQSDIRPKLKEKSPPLWSST